MIPIKLNKSVLGAPASRRLLSLASIVVFLYLFKSPAIAAELNPSDRITQSYLLTKNNLMIVYPKKADVISAPSTFLIGSCPPGSILFCQNEPVKINAQGFFAHIVNLEPGINTIELLLDNSYKYIVTIKRRVPAKPVKSTKKFTSLIKPINPPIIASTIHNNTTVRVAPEQDRTTPLPKGVNLLIDGQQGNAMRCLLAPNHHVWINKDELKIEAKKHFLATSSVKKINIETEPSETDIVIPLSQRLPFQLVQELNPNCLTIKIYGAAANANETLLPTAFSTKDLGSMNYDILNHCTYKQLNNHIFEITAHLNGTRQWGYWVDYVGSNLILHIKEPPTISKESLPLAGVIICVDPGHGGNEAGSIGPSGIKESTINLAIAEKLKPLLERDGAKVIMTRSADQEDVSLNKRVQIALANKADLLISIHNNALPDGRDPWKEHGSACYWYQPQSIELANYIKKSLMSSLGFPDYGTNFKSLALARPSNMLAVLVEVGFMIHPDEYAQLINPDIQQQAALALESGIKSYLH